MVLSLKQRYSQGRDIQVAHSGDEELGALQRLPGKWINSKAGKIPVSRAAVGT